MAQVIKTIIQSELPAALVKSWTVYSFKIHCLTSLGNLMPSQERRCVASE